MTDVLVSIGLILLLILFGGVFVASEIALVSLRESQIKGISDSKRGRRVAALSENPNRFLAAVQIGVTAAGFLSAAFGEARLSSHLAPKLEGAGLSHGLADVVSLILITLVISYVAITVGELAPKRIALQRAEGTALLLAPVVDRFARLARPVIWFLSKTTDLLVRMLGGDPTAKRDAITEEELRGLVASHESLTRDERKLIDEVFAAGERQIREVMIPRTEVEFLEHSMTVARAAKVTADQPHSRYPVARSSQDDIAGFVHVRDLLLPAAKARTTKVSDVTRDVKMLPGTKKVLAALSEMRREGHHLAIVVDEYGGTAGIVTLEDLIEEVIGDIRDEYDAPEEALQFPGGEMEADGLLNLDEVKEQTGVRLPEGPYETLAGFVMATLGHLPRLGDAVEADAHRLEVSQLDGRRVSRVRVAPIVPEAETEAS
ncbi:MAG: magnesium and cobalt exporter, family [Frankiales bacterium]|nr:magnesium and cobalt exporter, family [Frankiales bacterium]